MAKKTPEWRVHVRLLGADAELKPRYLAACKALDTTMSEDIREHMKSVVFAHDVMDEPAA